nr:hypothetical protein [Pyrococcus yayanosii]
MAYSEVFSLSHIRASSHPDLSTSLVFMAFAVFIIRGTPVTGMRRSITVSARPKVILVVAFSFISSIILKSSPAKTPAMRITAPLARKRNLTADHTR